jgi:putative spermidine/putrescine transport system permease protein
MGVALASAAGSVILGTFLAYRVWQLPRSLAGTALVYKIPLILPHIAVALIIFIFWYAFFS